MAQKLGFFSQWLGGSWAERNTINANAEALQSVEGKVSDLQATADRQAQEILQLRATLIGLAEVIQAKMPFESSDLEHAVNAALEKVNDPYRTLPADGPGPEDLDAAKKLMRVAEEHHFSKRFSEARSVYEEVVANHGGTEQAAAARKQIENLRDLPA